MKKKYLLVLLLFFSFVFPIFSENETIVNIESAQKTEYRKIEEDDVVVFTGNVRLSVTQNDDVIFIEADNVTFNRNRSVIFAEGNVVFTESGKSGNKSSESLTASSLLFNTKTMEGVFDSARVVQESSDNINIANGTTLIVSSELFGKENSGTVTFKNGVLTFCDDENPHWKIKASRIWLLPGNEFSFLNALLYVGNLPIFYMPFFYYPKDEMIFNPVFGYRPREGYFVQTTTYLVGRKPLNTSSSNKDEDEGIFDFMKTTDLMEQEKEGLFLKNTDKKATMPKNSLKVMGDLYSNLGGMVGIEGSFKDIGIISKLDFATNLGFSNSIFSHGNNEYSKFSPTGKTYYNSSYLFGLEIPFRLYTNLNLSISKSPFSLSINIPFYSDPWFKNDFLNRSESMDWIDFLLDDSKNEEAKLTETSSYSWNINGSISKPSFIKNLSPYIENLSISSLSSSINFLSRKNTDLQGEDSQVSPQRTFFYPSSVYPLKANFNISGKFLSIVDGQLQKKSSDKQKNSEQNFINQLENPLVEKIEKTEKKSQEEDVEFLDKNFLPKISTTSIDYKKISKYSYNLSYGIKPQFSSEITYFTDEYKSPKDIDLSKTKMSFIKFSSPVNLSSSFQLKNQFLSINNNFNFSPVFQDHPSVNSEYLEKNPSSANNIKKSDYNARKLDLTNSNSVKFLPFVFIDGIKDFSVSWNTGINMIKTKFMGDIENPVWEYETAKWDPDFITSNNLSATFSFNQLGGVFSESFTFTANLPPLVDSYTFSLKLKFPFCDSLQASLGYKQKSKTDETWVKTPLSQSSSWSFFDKKFSFTQNFKYNLENKNAENMSLSLKGFGLTISYTMSYTNPYTFSISDGTWNIVEEKEFLPYELRLNYSLPSKKFTPFKEKLSIAPTLSSTLSFDLIQITDSYFSFTPGFTIKINNFLDFSFSSESRNDVIYRYMQDYIKLGINTPGETNAFKDLLNSFAFGNNSLRQASGFKLKRLKMTLSHDLHDWTLNSSFTLEPRLIKTSKPYRYDFSPYFTLSVAWKPMSSMKTTVEDKYGEFILY